MNSEHNNGGLVNRPPYKLLDNNGPHGNIVGQIEQDENKFWSAKSLYVLAGLQMLFGVVLCATQFAMNTFNCEECKKFFDPIPQVVKEVYGGKIMDVAMNLYEKTICGCTHETYAMWCGGIIFVCGFLSTLTAKFKTNLLLVVSSFLCVVVYGVSVCCLVMSIIHLAEMDHNNDTYRGPAFVGMAFISGINFFISIFISALFCRASCSCCQPHSPAMIYLSPADVSSTTVLLSDNFVTASSRMDV